MSSDKRSAPEDSNDQLTMSDEVATAQLADSLDACGRRNQVMVPSIRPLREGMRAFGRARTVRFEPCDTAGDDPYDDMINFIDSVEPHDVVIIATEGDARTAYWGELFTAAAKGRGAAGVICDSNTRDRDKVLALDFPVFCVGTRPVDYRARMQITAVQEPVDCGGVEVSPGDYVLADDDGIVVVPQEVASDALARANERVASETTVLEELLSGASLAEVWQRYRVL